MGTSRRLTVSDEDRQALERVVRAPSTPQKVVLRAKIVLMSGEGQSTASIVAGLGTTYPTVTLWRERYEQGGVEIIVAGAPRPGRPPTLKAEMVAAVIERTLHEKPAGATHWSTRTLAAAMGMSHVQVHRVWKAHGLKPHLVKTFKLSTDPRFIEKLQDVVGLYMNPPEKAVVFSVDEKSQIQALERTQPGLPMKKGRAGTMTHDYKRHGTTTLFAALNVASGDVLGKCYPRHRHDEFLDFLKGIERTVDKDLNIEIIVDNYATHYHLDVQDWLAKHPRVHMHFTPTSSSWVNLVERFFAELTDKALRRGVFTNLNDLETTIDDYIGTRNENPRPFVWTAKVTQIIKKVARARRSVAAAKDSLGTDH
jgi:transposase